jgi:hypothetical protein
MMTNIVYTLLKEVFLSLVGKLAFKVLAERFMTRLVIYGLEKIRSYTTNEVIEETVQDVLSQLKGKRLKVIDELGD